MNSRSELYGSGVFTTIRVIDGRPWLWEKHARRLQDDAVRLGMDLSSITAEDMLSRVEVRIRGEGLTTGRLRLTISDKRSSTFWPNSARNTPAMVSVQTGPLNPVPQPFRLGISAHLLNSTSSIAGLKTGNYLEHLMALDAAKASGHSEAIRMNERGQVASACLANIFWLRDDTLFTPSVGTGCLPGTTREFLMASFTVSEVEAGLEELRQADAIFLTSAGVGVVAVNEFDDRVMSASDHPILRTIPDAK